MKAHIKDALMTTAIVLATIWIARKVPVLGSAVDTAING